MAKDNASSPAPGKGQQVSQKVEAVSQHKRIAQGYKPSTGKPSTGA